jgi:ADYC domain
MVIIGCKGKPTPPTPKVEEPKVGSDAGPTLTLCSPPEIHQILRNGVVSPYVCPPPCGGNSPMVNSFPVNGAAIHGDGACNPEGVQIVPNSVNNGKCAPGSNLTFDGTNLVAVHGADKCQGDDLEHSTFEIRNSKGTSLTLEIAKVKPVGSVQGYRIVVAEKQTDKADKDKGEADKTDKRKSLCDPDTSNKVRSGLGLPPYPTYKIKGQPDAADDGNADFVVPIGGPIYSDHVKEIDKSGALFNLACADDALAKRTFYSLFENTPDSEMTDLAALRMLTATYCGRPYTKHGMEIGWAKKKPATHKAGDAEARWEEDHVTCIQEPRLGLLKQKGVMPSDLPDELTPDGCKDKKHPCDWPTWKTKVRAECSEDEGSGAGSGSAAAGTGSGSGSAMPADCSKGDYDYESFLGDETAVPAGQMVYDPKGGGTGSGSGATPMKR